MRRCGVGGWPQCRTGQLVAAVALAALAQALAHALAVAAPSVAHPEAPGGVAWPRAVASSPRRLARFRSRTPDSKRAACVETTSTPASRAARAAQPAETEGHTRLHKLPQIIRAELTPGD